MNLAPYLLGLPSILLIVLATIGPYSWIGTGSYLVIAAFLALLAYRHRRH